MTKMNNAREDSISTEVRSIDDNGKTNIVGSWSRPPLQALICAIEQIIHKNMNTWNYVFDQNKHEITETQNGFAYFYGDNSVLYVTK